MTAWLESILVLPPLYYSFSLCRPPVRRLRRNELRRNRLKQLAGLKDFGKEKEVFDRADDSTKLDHLSGTVTSTRRNSDLIRVDLHPGECIMNAEEVVSRRE